MDELVRGFEDTAIATGNESFGFSLIDQSPQVFGLAQAHLVRNYTFKYLSTKGDVLGGLTSKQYGLVAIQARDALERGIDIYIGSQVGSVGHESSRITQLMNLLGSTNRASAEKGVKLLLANPITDSEVIEYAEHCFDYIENALELRPPHTSMGHGTKEERAVYDAESLEIARFTRYLNLNSPYTGSRFDEDIKSLES